MFWKGEKRKDRVKEEGAGLAEKYYALSVEEVSEKLKTSTNNGTNSIFDNNNFDDRLIVDAGLTDAEHTTRLTDYGPNKLEGTGGIKIHRILLRHTINFLQGVLAVAAGISIAIGEYIDAGVIGFLILINIVVGFLQEYRAERMYNVFNFFCFE